MTTAVAEQNRRFAWQKRDWIWLALTGLVLQGIWAFSMAHPSYMDAYYYTTNGRRLADGYGFTEEVIWQYLDNPESIPTPSHSYWMPLPSMLAAVGYTFTDRFVGAQLPFWLLAGLLPVLTYVISLQFTDERWQVWAACLFTAVGGYYSRFLNQPSTFAPFAWTGGLTLLFLAWAHIRHSGKWWLLAGVTTGLAHLTRADGVLLLGIGGLMWLFEIRDWRLEIGDWKRQLISNPAAGSGQVLQSPIFHLILLLAGYLLIMGGWFIHNWQVMGRPLPTSGTQTLFLTYYDDIFAYGRTITLSDYLAWGWQNILQSKIQGVSMAAQTFIAVSGLVFLGPFITWAWIKWGRQREKWGLLRPLTWYAPALFLAMSLVFTWPGQRGGLLHSSAALWTWMMTLAAGGIGIAVDWVAKRLKHWQPEKAKPIFAGLFILIALVISFATLRSSEEEEPLFFQQVGEMVPDTVVVMSGNAPAFYYFTGIKSISVPNEPVEGMLEAAAQFNATYLILDENRPRPLAPLYEGSEESPNVEYLGEYFDRFKLYKLHPPE
ncbi:MAG TPA: hypothetical protein EYH05_18055 [Anaerolineae bacterium]|nr:hypothetical protein [Anaerolineae bacterium]